MLIASSIVLRARVATRSPMSGASLLATKADGSRFPGHVVAAGVPLSNVGRRLRGYSSSRRARPSPSCVSLRPRVAAGPSMSVSLQRQSRSSTSVRVPDRVGRRGRCGVGTPAGPTAARFCAACLVFAHALRRTSGRPQVAVPAVRSGSRGARADSACRNGVLIATFRCDTPVRCAFVDARRIVAGD